MVTHLSSKKSTLVLGASAQPGRYSHQAVLKLQQNGHPVVAFGRHQGVIGDVPILTDWEELPVPGSFDTITLYLSAENQQPLAERLLSLKPRRILFNPGAENPTLARRAREAGIEAENACTLVLLGTQQY